MSWLFGSKKKEPPNVTIDPTPIEESFCVIEHPLDPNPIANVYPNLSYSHNVGQTQPVPLPYTVMPSSVNKTPYTNYPGRSTTTMMNNASNTPQTIIPGSSSCNENIMIHNQLDSVPFCLSPHLSIGDDSSDISNSNKLMLRQFDRKLGEIKKSFENGDFEYDFHLERNIMRESSSTMMVNGNFVY